MDADEFKALLAAAIAQVPSAARRHFIEARLLAPYQTRLRWEYGNCEEFAAWVFAGTGRSKI